MIARCTLLVGSLALCFAVLAVSATAAEVPTDEFVAGNTAYAAGRYVEAAEHFEADIAAKGPSAARLFNLANAYQAVGKNGIAILHYEQARRMDWGSDDIEKNRAAAYRAAGRTIDSHSGLRRMSESLSMDTWMSLSLAALALLSAMAFAFGLHRLRKVRGAAYVASVAAIVLGISAFAIARRLDDLDDAYVVSSSATLLISPQKHAEPLASLPEGTHVRIERRFGDYLYIARANEVGGWARRDSVRTVRDLSPDLAAKTRTEPALEVEPALRANPITEVPAHVAK